MGIALYDIRNLDPFSKLILVYLCDHYNESTGECFPSQNRIIECSNISRATVIRRLQKLEKDGLITRKKRYNDSDVYELNFDKIDSRSQPDTSQRETFEVSGGDTNQNEPLPLKKKKYFYVHELELDDDLRQYAKDKGVDPEALLESLKLWSEANGGKKYQNLKSFFKNCVLKESKKPKKLETKINVGVAERRMLTLEEYNNSSDVMKDFYRRNRPDILKALNIQ